MTMFFASRSKARNFTNNSVNAQKVVDKKTNMSSAGSRWGVVIKKPR